jgi:group I intron endonuclease
MEKIVGIYSIRNIINNKIYIGQSKNFIKRKLNHIRELTRNKHANIHLQNSWNKYGKLNFIFSILEQCDILLLSEREQYWLDYYGGINDNSTYNLGAIKNGSLSEETKKRIGIANKGKKISEKRKLEISEFHKGQTWNLGRKMSEETKEKIRQANLGKKVSNETRKKISDKNKGKKISDETKLKISIANKGRKISIEQREHLRIINLGKKHSDETKRKCAEAGKKNIHFTEKQRERKRELAKIFLSNLGRKHSDETKLRMSESAKIREQKKRELKNGANKLLDR